MSDEHQVKRQGDQIILPEGMSSADAIRAIKRHDEDQARIIDINEKMECFPIEGAYALHKALSTIYRWVDMVPTPSFFGNRPPHMLQVPVDHLGKVISVPWGRLEVAKFEGGWLSAGAVFDKGRWVFSLCGQVQRKFQDEVLKISTLIRKILLEESLYKGKAIKVDFDGADPDSFDPTKEVPSFVDATKIRAEDLMLNKDTMDLVDSAVLTPLRSSNMCRKLGIPLKRGVLASGRYGTGKTLLGSVVAKVGTENGWTFIYLSKVTGLAEALLFAKQYAPSIVFAEDVDQYVGTTRDGDVNDVLNTIDGIELKGVELMTILTTNHVENINPAMLREGRMDAIIHFDVPNEATTKRLLVKYGRGLIDNAVQLDNVAKLLTSAQSIPARIREVVERAKLSAIRRMKHESDKLSLNENDLMIAAKGVIGQAPSNLRKSPEIVWSMVANQIGRTIGDMVGQGIIEASSALKSANESPRPIVEGEIVNKSETLTYSGEEVRS
jgi:transitional endoplasmic reticulum ATPase